MRVMEMRCAGREGTGPGIYPRREEMRSAWIFVRLFRMRGGEGRCALRMRREKCDVL